jgi:hypothetical protein
MQKVTTMSRAEDEKKVNWRSKYDGGKQSFSRFGRIIPEGSSSFSVGY